MKSSSKLLHRDPEETIPLQTLHQVRAVALTDFAIVAESVGLNPFRMLEQAGLDAAMLEDGENRLSASAVVKLLDDCADQSGCESFGILMARRRTFPSLGRIAPVLKGLNSLRQVMGATNKLRRQLNDIVDLEVIDGPQRSFIRPNLLPQFAGKQALQLVTAMSHILLRGASRGEWKPEAVHFAHREPKDVRPFQEFFGCPLKFNSHDHGFEYDREALDRPFSANPLIAAAETIANLERELGLDSALPAKERAELEQIIGEIRSQIGGITDCDDPVDSEN